MIIRRVSGVSMMPTFRPGGIVVAHPRRRVKQGHVVLARQAGREVIKRVVDIRGDHYYLWGDNSAESVDSREYGPVHKDDILGVVKFHATHVTTAPSTTHNRALIYGWGLGLLLALLAMVQLFRIDKMIPEVQRWQLVGGYSVDVTVLLLVIVAEIFAIPFLLRMKLSPLMHLMSGALCVLVPWAWLLIDIWMLGASASTLQLGNYIILPSTLWVVILNISWLGLSLYVLQTLGYASLLSDLRKNRS